MDPVASLIGAVAALLIGAGFLLRAALPYVQSLGRAAVRDRQALSECEDDRRALEARIVILENAIRGSHVEPE